MGYIRQGLAFGFILYSYTYLIEDKKHVFIFLTLIGATFHISALLNLVFLGIFFIGNYNFKNIAIIIFAILIAYTYYLLENEEINRLYLFYFGDLVYFGSQGAIFRWIINLIPSIIFIFLYKKLSDNKIERKLYLSISIISILLVYYLNNYSTFVDRIILYLSSIQIVVFSRLPFIFKNNFKNSFFIKIGIIVFYLLLMFIFFKYSIHGHVWLPYKSILF